MPLRRIARSGPAARLVGLFVLGLVGTTRIAARDCNRNSIADDLDLADGHSRDCNFNGEPDECDLAPGSFRLGAPAILEVPPTLGAPLLFEDLDGDRLLDLVVNDSNSNEIWMLAIRSQAAGLVESETFIIESLVTGLAAGDMNSDDRPDLVFADSLPFTFWQPGLNVYPNDGRGGFRVARAHAVGNGVRAIVAADFDRDGDPDLATADEEAGGVTIVWNERGALEGTDVQDGVPRRPVAVVAADFDQDGASDLAVAGLFKVSLLLSREKRSFALASSRIVGSDPKSVASGDFDGDGDPDLATANALFDEFPDNVSIFLNAGQGVLGSVRNFAVGLSPLAIAAGDLDGDGDLDLVTANSRSGDLSVLAGLGDGTFATARPILHGTSPFFVRALDLDGDRDLDLVFLPGNSLLASKNAGAGQFSPEQEVFGGGVASVEAVDLDGDLDPDLVGAHAGLLLAFANRGNGSFHEAVELDVNPGGLLPVPSPAAGQGGSGDSTPKNPTPNAIASVDFDGDDDNDLALAYPRGPLVAIALNQTAPALPDADADGIPDECEPPRASPFRRGDPNQDGRADISDAITILRQLFQTGKPLSCRKAADANDDSRVDLSDAVSILRHLFLGEGPPPAPFPDCGEDPTADGVECLAYSRC